MKFLIISQRAIPNRGFKLNNLEGHGRIDVMMRCILAACRSMPNSTHNTIYCYLKGSENREEWGWITWNKVIDNHDEVSLAAEIKENWGKLFTQGNLIQLIDSVNHPKIIYLHEDGETRDILYEMDQEALVVLGAQSDLRDEDLEAFEVSYKIKLSNQSMLASHVITLFRQLNSL